MHKDQIRQGYGIGFSRLEQSGSQLTMQIRVWARCGIAELSLLSCSSICELLESFDNEPTEKPKPPVEERRHDCCVGALLQVAPYPRRALLVAEPEQMANTVSYHHPDAEDILNDSYIRFQFLNTLDGNSWWQLLKNADFIKSFFYSDLKQNRHGIMKQLIELTWRHQYFEHFHKYFNNRTKLELLGTACHVLAVVSSIERVPQGTKHFLRLYVGFSWDAPSPPNIFKHGDVYEGVKAESGRHPYDRGGRMKLSTEHE